MRGEAGARRSAPPFPQREPGFAHPSIIGCRASFARTKHDARDGVALLPGSLHRSAQPASPPNMRPLICPIRRVQVARVPRGVIQANAFTMLRYPPGNVFANAQIERFQVGLVGVEYAGTETAVADRKRTQAIAVDQVDGRVVVVHDILEQGDHVARQDLRVAETMQEMAGKVQRLELADVLPALCRLAGQFVFDIRQGPLSAAGTGSRMPACTL